MKQRHKSITIICPNCSLKQTAFVDMGRSVDIQNISCVNHRCKHLLTVTELGEFLEQTVRDFITI